MNSETGAAAGGRALYPDTLRGVAITLMLYGHCLQMGSGPAFRTGSLYFDDRVYQFIYSFHMPLFMVLSGALFALSLARDPAQSFGSNLKKRLKRLILPVLLWSVLDLLVLFLKDPAALAGASAEKGPVLYALEHFLTSHWYLWAVFFSVTVTFIIFRFVKDRLSVHLMLLVLAFFVPDGLNLMMYKFLHPFFLIGYYGISRLESRNTAQGGAHVPGTFSMPEIYRKHKGIVLAVFAVLFAAMFPFYNRNTFIYVSGYKLIRKASAMGQLGTDIFRFLIGAAGCAAFLTAWDLLLGIRGARESAWCRLLAFAGRESLGIYIISQYVITGLLVPASDRIFAGGAAPGLMHLGALLETVPVFAVSLGAACLFRRSRVLRPFIGV